VDPAGHLTAVGDPVLDLDLDLERRHPLKLRDLVRHQNQALASGVSCDAQVIHPDGLADFFKGRADDAVVLGGLRVIGQDFQTAAKLLDGQQVIVGALAVSWL
jgi:hypothetical protein